MKLLFRWGSTVSGNVGLQGHQAKLEEKLKNIELDELSKQQQEE